jgi:hypothetical protein
MVKTAGEGRAGEQDHSKKLYASSNTFLLCGKVLSVQIQKGSDIRFEPEVCKPVLNRILRRRAK